MKSTSTKSDSALNSPTWWQQPSYMGCSSGVAAAQLTGEPDQGRQLCPGMSPRRGWQTGGSELNCHVWWWLWHWQHSSDRQLQPVCESLVLLSQSALLPVDHRLTICTTSDKPHLLIFVLCESQITLCSSKLMAAQIPPDISSFLCATVIFLYSISTVTSGVDYCPSMYIILYCWIWIFCNVIDLVLCNAQYFPVEGALIHTFNLMGTRDKTAKLSK